MSQHALGVSLKYLYLTIVLCHYQVLSFPSCFNSQHVNTFLFVSIECHTFSFSVFLFGDFCCSGMAKGLVLSITGVLNCSMLQCALLEHVCFEEIPNWILWTGANVKKESTFYLKLIIICYKSFKRNTCKMRSHMDCLMKML